MNHDIPLTVGSGQYDPRAAGPWPYVEVKSTKKANYKLQDVVTF